MLVNMQTVMVYSETGGASKTTTAVSLAMVAATQGRKTVLIDLDPRSAATKWIDIEPAGEGLHVGSILGNEDPEGWAQDLAMPTAWHANLRMIPSARSVSNREADRGDHVEVRLRRSLIGLEADVVVIDCPNRQGGPLTQSALTASTVVVYAATPTSDGVDGYYGAQTTVQKFRRNREALGAPTDLREAGIVVGGYHDTVTPRAETASVDELRDTGLMITPLVPNRTIVQEARTARDWYGNYRKGRPVLEAYEEITGKVLSA
jgi:chromosome partitioning protein